jgi:hypothetical protein
MINQRRKKLYLVIIRMRKYFLGGIYLRRVILGAAASAQVISTNLH